MTDVYTSDKCCYVVYYPDVNRYFAGTSWWDARMVEDIHDARVYKRKGDAKNSLHNLSKAAAKGKFYMVELMPVHIVPVTDTSEGTQ